MSLRNCLLLALAMVPAIGRAQGAIAVIPNDALEWFQQPCLGDSADTWGWTRYDLHGVRLWVPREAKQVPVPGGDELYFRAPGGATLHLRLHPTARALFREYNTPGRVHRSCTDDIGGLPAEAVSFRLGGNGPYGFAVNWSDADRGEYLTAVITGRLAGDVAFLRRVLFEIQFPGERRRF